MLFNYKYGGSSTVTSNAGQTGISFAPDTLRQPTFFVGQLSKNIPFREAISALHDVVVSDLRFKPKDKTEYKEWAAQQEEIWLGEYMAKLMEGKEDMENRIKVLQTDLNDVYREKQSVLAPYNRAKSNYFQYIYKRDYDAWFVLDPVITVHPDEMFFECFSQDESTYGKLGANYNVFKNVNEFECGTTNIDYSAALYNEFQKIRNYKDTDFRVDPSGFEIQTGEEDLYKEVKIDLPESWVRGFLQVSSAMTLPAESFDLHPMDVYNICLMLRRYRAKKSPRSMKYILKPGEPIKIIFEPWNYELECPRSIYPGKEEREVRVWGRRRLLILERLIPITKKFRVHLLGTGLPSFYVADLGDMNFTLGLSGWTANDWSRAGNFDLMAPRMEVDNMTKKLVYSSLKENWSETSESLAKRLDLEKDVVAGALSAYTQAGRVIYDLDKNVYRVRELSREPLPMSQLRFANPREKDANRLLQGEIHVAADIVSGVGLKLTGSVKDRYRTHHPELVIDSDERMKHAVCDCYFYNSNKLKKGPCEHILALRMKHNKTKKNAISA